MQNRNSGSLHNGERITVITPAYNSAGSLARCIESLIAQTYGNWELILIDDGSTDHTPAVCDRYAEINAGIHVIHIPNSGPAAARNRGIDAAHGELLYFLDADDCLEPDALELMIREFRNSAPDLIVGGLKRVCGEKMEKETYYPHTATLDHSQVLDYLERYRTKPNRTPMFTSVWGKLYRMEILRKHRLAFNAALHVFEDADFNFRYLRFVEKMVYLDVYSYHYTYMVTFVSASTRISDHPEKMFDHLAALHSLAALFRERYPDRTPAWIVGHACISLTIIQLVRICGQSRNIPAATLRELAARLIREPLVRQSLSHYTPGKGESRLLPRLIRMKLTPLIIPVCRYKAKKRYGKCKPQ